MTKIYTVSTETDDILDTFSYEEALDAQKHHPGSEIIEMEVEVLPGETASDAAWRVCEELGEEVMESSKPFMKDFFRMTGLEK